MSLEQLVSVNLFQFFLVFARLGSAIMLLPGFGDAGDDQPGPHLVIRLDRVGLIAEADFA